MKHSYIYIPALIIFSVVMLSCEHHALAQPSNTGTVKKQIDNNVRLRSLMNELHSTVTTLRKERQGYYTRKQEKDLDVQGLRVQIQALRVTQGDLIGEVEDIEEVMKTLNDDRDKLKTTISGYQEKEDKLSNSVLSYVKQLREQVDNAIPYRLEERTANLDAIANDISTQNHMDIAEVCNQLWSFCKEELRLSVTGETYRDTIQLTDGREPHAEFLRVGKIILAFVTEDGKDAGVWLRGAEAATATGWVRDSSNAPIHSIAKAIKIHKMQHPPEIINFPISFSPVGINTEDN